MTDDPDRDGDRGRDPADHRFSTGRGFDAPYEGFDLDPPTLDVDDPSTVDPVDSHALADVLDERHLAGEDVDADELVEVGLNYMGINRHEQATEAFERAARFAEETTTEQEAWVNKGVAHAELEEWDAAISAHREALHVDEDGEFAADAHTNLAYALWEFGETEEAFHHAEVAVRTDQRLPQAWYNLGFLENEQNRPEQAADALDNAIRLGFRSADVYEEKARALEALGREAAAEDAREQAETLRERAEEDLVR
ncbi:MAG: tetratricopeptide repeat protein [Halobacteriaceae archaeon]